MFNAEKIGQRIALLRKEKGYSQEELASFFHITGQAVSKWEKGHAMPDTALLPVLAEVLETSIDRILTGADFVRAASPYDKEYEKPEYYWGLKHSELAEQVVNILQRDSQNTIKLLDVGSGEGRDAIYFAQCGYVVDALEISLPGIEKIEHYSHSTGHPVNAIQADLIDYALVNDYDVIYSMGALQFLPPRLRQRQFEQYKKFTRPHGIHAHLVFVEKPFIAVAPDWQTNEYFYKSGDLACFYHDWEILLSGEAIVECESAHIPHRHALSYIIAQKPDNAS